MGNNIKVFEVVDILHTGHHGPAGESKQGLKYDNIRNRLVKLDMDSLITGESIALIPVVRWTTPFEKFFFADGLYHIVTLNSEYLLREIIL